jgi:hypothetical protein
MSDSKQEFKHFAFVVDGVVVEIMSIASSPEWNNFNELYSSRPTIIEVPASLEEFGKGYRWDGENFSPPTE